MLDIASLFSRRKELLGLDIGSSSLKLVEIQDSPAGYTLTRFYQMPLPKGVIVDGLLVDQRTLTEKIKELIKQCGCRNRGVVTSLSGQTVIVKKVNFATMEEGELRELIHDEAGKYLPFEDMEDVNYDFQILGTSEFNPNLMDVLIVAAKKETVANYTDAIKDAGLNPAILDVDSFALENMYEENYDYQENEMTVIVNIGASITNINVVQNAMSVFTRDFTLGGNTVTEAIQEKLGGTFEEAERIKVEGVGADEAVLSEVRANILQYADALISEIERSIEYFRSNYGGDFLKKVLLSGGSAKIPGLVAELMQRLNIETEIVNPFRKIEISPKAFDPADVESIAPVAAVGVGLALRRVGDK